MIVRTNGNARYWGHRPSDHRAGMREYWHGRLQPMPEPRTGFLARLMGRGRMGNRLTSLPSGRVGRLTKPAKPSPPSPNRSKGCGMDKDELLELAERVEALTGPDREVDAAIYQALNPHMTPVPEQVGRFYDATRTNARIAGKYYLASGATGAAERWTGSIDAASDLVPERYKRHITMVISPASIDMGRRDYQAYLGGHARKGRAQSFALALTAAALRARAAQQPSGAMTGE